MSEDALTYRDAGVDIDQAYRSLRGVLGEIQATYSDRVVEGVGGFGGLFHATFPGYERPVLVSSIDGVGTKTKVAAMMGSFRGIGHDIVNHCVNDILCQGARPLFFMDYFGASGLQAEAFEEVLRGVTEACRSVEVALLGGETAELPGVYHDGEMEVVGSIVGVVEFEKRLPKSNIQAGDALIGLASDGLHTNGFSLARKALFETAGMSVRDEAQELSGTLGEALLKPHRCYFHSVFPLLERNDRVRGIAHVTGGGLYDNVPRMLPAELRAVIERRAWTPPPLFRLIQEAGKVQEQEMYRTFNMGIGLVLLVERDAAPSIVRELTDSGEAAAVIGEVHPGGHDVQIV